MKYANFSHFTLLGLLFFLVSLSACDKPVVLENLRCEYLTTPEAIDTYVPRFTWNYAGEGSLRQRAYRVRIATTPQLLDAPDIWDSGDQAGAATRIAPEEPLLLSPGTTYYWAVTTLGDDGKERTARSRFRTALLEQKNWTAQWISDTHDKDYKPAPLLRKSFLLEEKPVDARVYVTGVGYYELFINGERVGDHRLDPAYTHFDKRVLYSVFNLTDALQKGENVLGAVLGNGFYNWQTQSTWDYDTAYWRERPRFLCELHVTYPNGTQAVIATDGTWRTATGGYCYNNLSSGDVVDAGALPHGWNTTGFDASAWTQASVVTAPTRELNALSMPPIRITQEIKPVWVKRLSPTRYVYDFGINLTGVCRLNVAAPQGTTFYLKHGEQLNAEGVPDRKSIGIYFLPQDTTEQFQTDTYICAGEGQEEFTPAFTYHGFRYVEVETSAPVSLDKTNLTALFFHTDVQRTGVFHCSNALLNQIYDATMRSYVGNLHGIPTDCPQREKNGWTADAHVSMDLGLLNYDGITFYEKWLRDFVDNQRPDGRISGIIPSSGWGYDDWIGPVWDAALFIMPATLYQYYGDPKMIEALYPVCERYLTYLKRREDAQGTVTYGLGDWLPYDTRTPEAFTSSCYYYWDYKLMADFARLLGRDAAPYAAKAAAQKETINRLFFQPDSASYANGSQTALALPLYFGLVPQEYEQAVADRLARDVAQKGNHLDFGVAGSKTVPRMLAKYGYADLAFAMASQESAPSWGYWIKSGFTTLGETWIITPTSKDASLNHVFMGDISAWMTSVLAGIDPWEATPGFTSFTIRPHFVAGLDQVEASYASVQGTIRSSWKRTGDTIALTVVVPPNTQATVLADKSYAVGGGTHRFTFKPE